MITSSEESDSSCDESFSSSSDENKCNYVRNKIQNLKILTVKKLDQGDKFIQPVLIKGKNDVNHTILIEFQQEEINDAPINVFIDAGADVNVISEKEADSINIKWKKYKLKLWPYGSKPLKVCGKYEGPIKFGKHALQSEINIVKQNLEVLILSETAELLGIISFNAVNTIQSENSGSQKFPNLNDENIKTILNKHNKFFSGTGKCKDKKIKLHLKDSAKPCIQPIRPIPFHLRKKFDAEVDKMIKEGVFEEHKGPTEWLSNPVIKMMKQFALPSITGILINHY